MGLMGLVGLDGLLGAVRLVGLVVVVSYIRFNCKRKNGVKMDGKKFQGVRCQMAKVMKNSIFLEPFHKNKPLLISVIAPHDLCVPILFACIS